MSGRYDKPRTLVATATYNERENIPVLLKRIHGLGEDLEVLVVDDDETIIELFRDVLGTDERFKVNRKTP